MRKINSEFMETVVKLARKMADASSEMYHKHGDKQGAAEVYEGMRDVIGLKLHKQIAITISEYDADIAQLKARRDRAQQLEERKSRMTSIVSRTTTRATGAAARATNNV